MKNHYTILGIDPGLSGAAILLNPFHNTLKVQRDFKNEWELSLGVASLAREATFAVLELVSPRPGEGCVSSFTFGASVGAVRGILDTLDVPFIEVPPAVWQLWVREYLGMTRNMPFLACEAAQRIAPQAHLDLFGRSKDHNTADAYFLALYGAAIADDVRLSSRKKGAVRRLPPLEEMIQAQRERVKTPGSPR